MNMSCGIYKITSPSGKIYVGQSVNIEKRWKKHCREDSGCSAIKNAIKKYGKENMTFQILLITEKEMLNYYEKEFIEIYDSVSPKGYNLTTGGDCCEASEETKQKMSESKKGNQFWLGKKHTEESKKKNREAHKGIPGSMKGKKHTEESKKKQSEAKKGKKRGPHTEETKTKMSESKKGIPTGIPCHNKGKKLNKITRKFE